ncbi:MAG: hypothetical protein F6K37_17345 [Moorea sp. SIO4E2]|uniref:tryptophan dimethylallyltransferase family protein n=1 Tax=Moorena sp. SIO4E2 TaxID=2607826 RepID=UPI0013B9B37A|nr:tryptophan dimethylallyltransferase family protein [Moorena sp. SIO4E2]NEQ07641.1 hypothetical protein [Moorena sp. SIO4E2]
MSSTIAVSEYASDSFSKADTRAYDDLPIFASNYYSREASYIDIACDKLHRACDGLAFPAQRRDTIVAFLRKLGTPWGDAVASAPQHFSNVSVEGMPFELSLAWSNGRGNELRMSFEVLHSPHSLSNNLEAARRFVRELPSIPELARDLSIENYLLIEDLVTAPDPTDFITPMGQGVAWLSDRPNPVMKTYLNLNIAGFESGPERTKEAMTRLGAGPAWQSLCSYLTSLGVSVVPLFLALDLAHSDHPRLKIYLPHTGVDAGMIDKQAEIAQTHVRGKFEEALLEITGHTTPDWRKVPVTCYTLVPGEYHPVAATLYVPLNPNIENDAIAQERVCAFSRSQGVDPSPYESLLKAISDQPLSQLSTHNFVAYRPGKDPRFSVYLAPGVYKRS